MELCQTEQKIIALHLHAGLRYADLHIQIFPESDISHYLRIEDMGNVCFLFPLLNPKIFVNTCVNKMHECKHGIQVI